MQSLIARLLPALWLVLVALLPSSQAIAQTEEPGSVRVGYPELAPYSSTGPVGIPDGYSVDIMRLLLAERSYAVQFRAYDTKADVLAGLEAGEIDVVTLWMPDVDAEALGHFTQTFGAIPMGLMVRHGDAEISSSTALGGLRVGAIRGSAPNWVTLQIEGATVATFQSYEEMILPLVKGDIDAVLVPVAVGRSLIAASGLADRLVMSDDISGNGEGALLVTRDRPRLLEDLDAAIDVARASGALDRLRDEWFPVEDAPPSLELNALFLTAVLIAELVLLLTLVACIAVWWHARRLTRRSTHFEEALNRTGVGMMLIDHQFQPEWWNDAYERSFLIELPLLRSPGQVTLQDLIEETLLTGAGGPHLPRGDAQTEAARQIAALEAGQEIKSIGLAGSGRALVRRTVQLPSKQYVVIATDISDIATDQDGMREEVERLIAANEQMEKFSQKVAHNLVGPVATQGNLLDLLRGDIAELGVDIPPETMEILEEMDASLGRQRQMVADLLEWSKLQHTVPTEDFDPTDRLAAAVAMAAVPPTFSLSLPETLPQLHGNPITFEMVVRNLLSNAKKHHDRGKGTIRLSCDIEGDHAVFRVIDDGPGIPSDYLSGVRAVPFIEDQGRRSWHGSGPCAGS